MKCPKCSYLGFERSDRCRNCGYDFSLAVDTTDRLGDFPLDPWRSAGTPVAPAAPDRPERSERPAALPLDAAVAAAHVQAMPVEAPPPPAERRAGRLAAASLPLFHPDDDAPLVKLPAAPRPPLAVRRTPERPRRVTPRAVRRTPAVELPSLPMDIEPPPGQSVDRAGVGADPARPAAATHTPAAQSSSAAQPAWAAPLVSCTLGRRMAGAAIDHLLLLGIDAIVIYFTLRMAGLPASGVTLLPPVPLASFLLMLKLAYFSAFTMVGGQTIGKMAVGIRVVGDDGSALEPTRAIRRTLVGAVTALAAGAGLVPLFAGSDRRGIHDRVARTRVIALRSERPLA